MTFRSMLTYFPDKDPTCTVGHVFQDLGLASKNRWTDIEQIYRERKISLHIKIADSFLSLQLPSTMEILAHTKKVDQRFCSTWTL